MSTWRLMADAGNSFRWESACPIPIGNSIQQQTPSDSRLPSMNDLLLQGYSKLVENQNEQPQGISVVTNNRSSTLFASDAVESHSSNNGCSSSGSLFQTASGKMVKISPAGLVRAKTLLGLDKDCNDPLDSHGHPHTIKQPTTCEPPKEWQNSSCLELKQDMDTHGTIDDVPISKSLSVFQTAMIANKLDNEVDSGNNGRDFSGSLFQTASGKMVNISAASLVRAKTLLRLDEADNNHLDFQGCPHTINQTTINEPPRQWQNSSCFEQKQGMNNYGIIDDVPILKSPSVFQTAMIDNKLDNEVHLNPMQPDSRNNGFGFPGSLFKTASGKTVKVSSAGLVRAKTLLGLDEDNSNFNFQTATMGKELDNKGHLNSMQSETSCSASKPPQIKFSTAGGKSISVSSHALKRARNLLGEPELGTPELGTILDNMDSPAVSYFKESRFDDTSSSNNENEFYSPFLHRDTTENKNVSKIFTSPFRSSSKQVRSADIVSGSNLIKRFDAVGNENVLPRDYDKSNDNACDPTSRKMDVQRSLAEPLVDITNRIVTACPNSKQVINQKRRFGINSVTPFKRPRNFKFTTPLNKNVPHVPTGKLFGLSNLSSEPSRRAISTRYPFQVPRRSVDEYFGQPPFPQKLLDHISDQVRWITSDNANSYTFCDESGSIGVRDFCQMLLKCGASIQYASKEWVTNHYKWIIWKLACYERYYPTKCGGNFLTVSNVLEELKYRYEREVNHGHRSAIKRILDGDSPPSSAMILCISAIRSNCSSTNDTSCLAENGADIVDNVKVELTDGWYGLDASLDMALTKQLTAGKLFVGQKLRVWGASLSGWMAPVSPFEASREVSLLLNINGTYRAHWADRLGFCKDVPAPLAFRCIKSNGGPVPWTLVGVTRIYPVLYKDKLCDGGMVVRTERMENKRLQVYSERRASIIEGIVSDFRRRCDSSFVNHGGNEGARIYKVLEMSAEPDVLMAEMSQEQLSSFASYKAKLEAARESELEKAIKKALEDAGLNEKNVNPFMRVKVVGLTGKNCTIKDSPKEGIITVWQPSEKVKNQLVEGQAYAISGLLPTDISSETLFLQARESTSKWHSLSPESMQQFRPFFKPRKPISLSNLGEVPLSSEFDVATFVVHVGEVHADSNQRKQWLFVTDGTFSKFSSGELPYSLLAICFCYPYVDDDSFAPINCNLEGSTVGFCNLIKKETDINNDMWVAEATDSSTYYLNFSSTQSSHLKTAAAAAQNWGHNSRTIINKLKDKVFLLALADESRERYMPWWWGGVMTPSQAWICYNLLI
ncbi:hypothetical protein ACFE04_000103 [Oxalis oulophora]